MKNTAKRYLVVAALVVVGFVLTAVIHTNLKSYEQTTIEHCQQFKVIPEEHLDRVPDGCVAEYFKGRNTKEDK